MNLDLSIAISEWKGSVELCATLDEPAVLESRLCSKRLIDDSWQFFKPSSFPLKCPIILQSFSKGCPWHSKWEAHIMSFYGHYYYVPWLKERKKERKKRMSGLLRDEFRRELHIFKHNRIENGTMGSLLVEWKLLCNTHSIQQKSIFHMRSYGYIMYMWKMIKTHSALDCLSSSIIYTTRLEEPSDFINYLARQITVWQLMAN